MGIPKEAKDLYNKAEEYIDNRQYENALDYLNKVLEITPNYAKALSTLGYVHVKLGFKEMSKKKVFEILKKALDLNPNTPKTWNNMGKFYGDLENYEKALEIDPKYAKAWNNMGIVYSHLVSYVKAIECYE